ncbi:hypothetical protein PTTG_00211 [Puccinia triticina 1-1 BBBD Race 1]|uniref:NAM-associated domain-containing protein n=1 Tax=Puccinia triticina (isolate 1-1 / race 1 (BBBD)) TaxID=630390 RepID=A0A180H0I9_PUCT1|nr:hypothetical protein PTTG_00211 [Puccinia triticina 1-1 BBBD Race 1]
MPPRKSRQPMATTQPSELIPASPTTQSQPPTQTDPPPKRRGPNFTPKEDEKLAKSWAFISQDGVTSNNQKAADFWAQVLEDFNQFTPGPQQDADGLSTSSPNDWMLNARGMYHEQVKKHFTADRAWNLLKKIPKFKDLDWERPPGIHQAKRKVSDNDYKRKKMKLLKASEKHSSKRTAEAKRANQEAKCANDIQAEWVAVDREKNEMNLMFQNVDNCPNDFAQTYLIAKKKDILDRLINPSSAPPNNTSNNPSSAPPTSVKDQSSRPPTSEKERDNESESESKKSDGDCDLDPTQTQTFLGAHEEPKFPLHPDLALL